MSRPKLLIATGSQVKLEVPPKWFITISAISRKRYNQLITCEFETYGDEHHRYIVNEWDKPNRTMRNLHSSEDILTIIPQEETVVIDLNVYFSTQPSIKGEALEDDKYRSSRLNVLGTQKPANAPKDFPDYSTFIIFAEDSPPATQVQGAPEYDDSLITINIIQSDIPPPPDSSSQALAQTGKDAIDRFINIYTDPSKSQGGPIIPPEKLCPDPLQPASPLPVCIIGAGVSGLYIAMMLQSLGIKYEIMEGSGRVGGRLYTHNFPNNPGKYQYYDVGAMRYPKTTFMTRTFKLAEKLGITMLDYIRGNDNAFLSYNRISVTKAANNDAKLKKDDNFKVSVVNDGTIPEEYIKKGSGYFWDVILDELRQNFVVLPFDEAFEKLKQWEDYSVTSYCVLIKKIPFPVVKWWEVMESRTGLFDQSLAETVLASLVFIDPNTKEPKWYCFDGGSEVVHKAMVDRLTVKPQLNMRVTAIKESDNNKSLTVTFNSGSLERKYSQVFSTMSFGCLRMVDLDNLNLSFGQRTAIRELMYMPSIKIGLQFKTAWWEKLKIVGGQSSTDRPIRDIVYPSYGPDASHPGSQKSNCMIASYNGMQDSQRLGGLFKGKGTPEEKVLIDLVLRDLAAVHLVDVNMLKDQLEDYYPWDFHRDEFQLGAFCHFAPGQFQYTYPHVTRPGSTDQRFHFAGDGTSTFHGWVAGALNSAWRAVAGMIVAHPEVVPNPTQDTMAKFTAEWGDSEEWDQRTLAKHTYLGRELTKLDLQNPNKPGGSGPI